MADLSRLDLFRDLGRHRPLARGNFAMNWLGWDRFNAKRLHRTGHGVRRGQRYGLGQGQDPSGDDGG